ncbi:hypothetical protein SSX86_016971 [Deinandra increscens subsp. villosa]|uniref:Uncharacterized protein n=1 Tax=Deinandra increscens subsp. villosa TaxID=3103831 RepID=A0AAP0CU77_9ASTR
MSEARDGLSRSNTVDSETYVPRRISIGSISVLQDNDSGERSYNQTPFRWGATPLTGGGSGQRTGETHHSTRTATRGGVSGRGLFGTPMTVYRRGSRNQNTPPSGNSSFRRGRGGRSVQHSVLPSWYPRTPLRDITHVVRAIERRRMHLGDGEGQILGSPINYQLMHHQTAVQDPSPLSVQLEHKASFVMLKPKISSKTLGVEEVIVTGVVEELEHKSLHIFILHNQSLMCQLTNIPLNLTEKLNPVSEKDSNRNKMQTTECKRQLFKTLDSSSNKPQTTGTQSAMADAANPASILESRKYVSSLSW